MISNMILSLCSAFVCALVYAEHRDSAGLRRLFKPAASLSFVLLAISAGAIETPFGQTVLAGLVLCALGDVLLIPRAPRCFLAGMSVFAAGHGAYVAAFVIGGMSDGPAAVLAAMGMAVLAAVMLAWLWRDLKDFKIPVAIYSAIIGLMVTASVAHHAAAPARESLQFVIAAIAFAISDLAVARDQFRKRAFVNKLWGLPLYYAAQCLFAISV